MSSHSVRQPHLRIARGGKMAESVEFAELAFERYQWTSGVHPPFLPVDGAELEIPVWGMIEPRIRPPDRWRLPA